MLTVSSESSEEFMSWCRIYQDSVSMNIYNQQREFNLKLKWFKGLRLMMPFKGNVNRSTLQDIINRDCDCDEEDYFCKMSENKYL